MVEHPEIHRLDFEKNQSKNFKERVKPRLRTMDRSCKQTTCSRRNADVVAGVGELAIGEG